MMSPFFIPQKAFGSDLQKAQREQEYMGRCKISEDHIFFGLKLTPEQEEFRDAIYGNDHDIVFCNAKSGTGKTQIAVATAKLLVDEGKYDGLVYIVNPVQEDKQGFLPGDINSKTMPYVEPLIDALIKINEMPDRAIKQLMDPSQQISIAKQLKAEHLKEGKGWIDCRSHTFLRGVNFENKVIIVDEAQNAYVDELKKILTRASDNCKVIVIGHVGQKDLLHNPERSGLKLYIEHFKNQERCKVCHLTKNFRGWISTWADELNIEKAVKEIKENE